MKRLVTYFFIFVLFISLSTQSLKALDNDKLGSLNWDKISVSCIYDDGRKYIFNGSKTKEIDNKRLDVSNTSLINDGKRGYYDLIETENLKIKPSDFNYSKLIGELIFAKPSHLVEVTERAGHKYLTCANNNFLINLKSSYKSKQNEGVSSAFSYISFKELNIQQCIDEVAGGLPFWKNETSENIVYGCNTIKRHNLLNMTYLLSDIADTKIYSLVSASKDNKSSPFRPNNMLYVYVFNNAVLVEENNIIRPLVGGNEIFTDAKIDNQIRLSNTEGNAKDVAIYFNDPNPKIVDGSSDYSSAAISYEASKVFSLKHHKKYIISDVSKVAEKNVNQKSICELIPETSKSIRQVIKYSQILIPMFLILLITLDIVRTIRSNEMDKDIPRLIKRIKVRLISAAIFFLAPLIVSLIVNVLQDAGQIKDVASINCLFSDHASVGKDDPQGKRGDN